MDKKWIDGTLVVFDPLKANHTGCAAAIEELLATVRYAESSGEWKDLTFEINDSEYFAQLTIYGQRLESDSEFEKRIAKETRSRKTRENTKAKIEFQKEERDRLEYERLRKKFEPGRS